MRVLLPLLSIILPIHAFLHRSSRTTVSPLYYESEMRAWHCHGRNQRELVDRLAQANIVQSPIVRQVLEMVDRQHYVINQQSNDVSYQDSPQSIGDGQTISAPHMHAHVLEQIVPVLLKQQQQSNNKLRVLDVGSGSGYLTACLGRLFSSPQQQQQDNIQSTTLLGNGKVIGIDIIPRLIDLATNNMNNAGDSDLLKSGTVSLHVANGWKGWPSAAPYDAIHVGAAAPSFPTELAQQLRLGGILILPLGPVNGAQSLYKVQRTSMRDVFSPEDFQITPLLSVRYVPLVQQPEVDQN